MVSRRTIILIILLALATVFIIFGRDNQAKEYEIARVKIGNAVFMAEIADEETKRNKGLSNRKSLASDKAMLFLFDSKAAYTFWMKGMRFPLDLIWISDDEVIGVSENLPPDNSDQPKIYEPPDLVDKVLEVNAGQVKESNIKIGDKVEILLL